MLYLLSTSWVVLALHWVVQNPSVVVLTVAAALANMWKTLPSETRRRIEVAHPRLVGALRFVYEMLPNVVDGLKAAYYQVLQGLPKHDAPAQKDLPPPPPAA